MSLRELSRCLVHLVRCGGRDKDDLIARREEDILAYNLDLPVMHQYINVENIRKDQGIEMTDQEWVEFMEDYEQDICNAWIEVFLQFLRERPPIETLLYPASEAPRNAGHPDNAGRPSSDFDNAGYPSFLTEDEEKEFLKEIQGLEEDPTGRIGTNEQ